jgi:hypothetical protein
MMVYSAIESFLNDNVLGRLDTSSLHGTGLLRFQRTDLKVAKYSVSEMRVLRLPKFPFDI